MGRADHHRLVPAEEKLKVYVQIVRLLLEVSGHSRSGDAIPRSEAA